MKRGFIFAGIFLLAAFALEAKGQSMYTPGMVRAGKNLRAPLDPPEQPAGEKSWLVEPDIELYCFSMGKGKNILLVHGGPGYPPSSPWPGMLPLKSEYRMHFYHQRGCGRSTRPVDKFTSSNYFQNMMTLDKALGLGAQIADIERIRRILGDEKLIIIGHSFGGFIASLYAVEFPEHVHALILVAPADALVMPVKGGGLFEEVGRRLPKSMGNEFKSFLKDYFDYGDIFSKSEEDLKKMNRRLAAYVMAAYEMEGIGIPPSTDLKGLGGWVTHAVYFSTGLRYDYRDALKKVEIPVLVIHGAKDLQPEEASRMYVDCFPNARLEVMKESSHFPFQEQPEEFSRIVGAFIAGQR